MAELQNWIQENNQNQNKIWRFSEWDKKLVYWIKVQESVLTATNQKVSFFEKINLVNTNYRKTIWKIGLRLLISFRWLSCRHWVFQVLVVWLLSVFWLITGRCIWFILFLDWFVGLPDRFRKIHPSMRLLALRNTDTFRNNTFPYQNRQVHPYPGNNWFHLKDSHSFHPRLQLFY